MEKPVTNKRDNSRVPLPPIANLVLAGVAIGLSYFAISAAIDTGSLLEYGIAAILFGMGIKNLVQFYQARSKK
jgi:hypothetical protein